MHTITMQVVDEGTSGCNFLETATAMITVVETPNATASNDSPACEGDDVILEALPNGNGETYTWEGPSAFSSTEQEPTLSSVTAANAGVYTVTVTESTGLCSATATTEVTIANPFPTAMTTATCDGGDADLSASVSGGTSHSYLWSDGATTSTTTVTGVATANNNDVYTVTVTSAEGCENTSTVALTVNALPSATAMSTAACDGADAMFSVSVAGETGESYLWSNGETTAAMTESGVANANDDDIFTVTVTNDTGCTTTATTQLTVNPLPSATAMSTAACDGDDAMFSVSVAGVTGESYLWSNGETTAAMTESGVANANNNDIFTVTVTNDTDCSTTATVQLTVNPLPSATAMTTAACEDGDADLSVAVNGGADHSYLWSDGATTSTTSVTGVTNADDDGDVYTVTVTSGAGCVTTATVALTVNTLPSATAMSTAACDGADAMFSVSVAGETGESYLWSNGETTAAMTESGVANANDDDIFTVTVTNDTGCTTTATTQLTVNPLPSATAMSTAACDGDDAMFSVSVAGVTGESYLWSNGETTAAMTESGVANANNNDIFTVTVTNDTDCSTTATVQLTVNPLPSATAMTTAACEDGDADLSVAVNGGADHSYLWSDGATTSTTSVTGVTNADDDGDVYTVTVTSGAGCVTTATVALTVNTLPSATAMSTAACDGADAMFSVSVAGETGESYLWSNGETTAAMTESGVANANDDDIFTVTVTNDTGCTTTATTQLTVNPVPSATAMSTAACDGDDAMFSVSVAGVTGESYLWSNGETTAAMTESGVANANNNDIFTVTVTNDTGCATTATTQLTVNALPSATAMSTAACDGADAMFSVAVAGETGESYLWSNGETTATMTESGVANANNNEIFTVTVTNDTDCSTTATVQLTVNSLPSATAMSTAACDGDDAMFSVAVAGETGESYLWSNGETTAAMTESGVANANDDDIFTVTVTNDTGCTTTATTQLTVNALPSATAMTTVVCDGDDADFSVAVAGVTGESYLWSNGETTATMTESGVTTANDDDIFTVTVTNDTGCTTTATAQLTVNTLPSATAMTTAVCDNADVELTSTVAGNVSESYLWSNGATTSTTTITGLTAVANDGDVYTVTVTNEGDCATTATVAVTIIAAPFPTIFPLEPEFCAGDQFTLGASSLPFDVNDSYNWSNGHSGVIGDGGGINENLTEGGVYTVTVTNTNMCVGTATVEVTENPLPSATAMTTAVCDGDDAELTSAVAGESNESYMWSDGATTSTTTVSGVTTANSGDVYTVTVTNDTGCETTATVALTVNALPSATAMTTATCDGGDAMLSSVVAGESNESYMWSNGATTSTTTITGVTTADSGTPYTVTVTNDTGCITTATVALTVNALPSATAMTTATCDGGDAMLSSVVDGESNESYMWSDGATTSMTTISGVTTANNGDVYTVTVTNDTGCENTATVALTVNALPSATAMTTATCDGDDAMLSAMVAGESNESYMWSDGATTSMTTVSGVTTANSGDVYTVTVTNDTGCETTATVALTVNALPSATAMTTATCDGGDAMLSSAVAGESNESYMWSNGATTSTTTITGVTTADSGTPYTVTVTNDTGCITTATVALTVNALPSATAMTTAVCDGDDAELTSAVAGESNESYMWSDGATTSMTTISGVTTANNGDVYTVTVTNDTGCETTATVALTVNALPSATAMTTATCDGDDAMLSAMVAGESNESYMWSDGATTSMTTISGVTTANNGDVYTVTVTNDTDCSTTATVALTVNALPSATAMTTATCDGGDAMLSSAVAGESNESYMWSDGATTSMTTISGVTTANNGDVYTVTVTNDTGCETTATVALTVNALPSATAMTTAVCDGGDAMLSSAVAGESNESYMWSDGATTAMTTVSGVTTANNGDVYTVTVTNDTDCSTTATVALTVNALPSATAMTTATCDGGDAILNAMVAGNSNESYMWSDGATTSMTTISGVTTANNGDVYTVTVTNYTDCSTTATIALTVNALPSATAMTTVVCDGDDAELTSMVAGESNESYMWSDGATTSSTTISGVTFANDGDVYTVTVTNDTGCTTTATTELTVNPSPAPTIVPVGTSAAFCSGDDLDIQVIIPNIGETYEWSNGDSGNILDGGNVTTVDEGGVYTVTVTFDDTGCSATATIDVTENPLPSATAMTTAVCDGDDAMLSTMVAGNSTMKATCGAMAQLHL